MLSHQPDFYWPLPSVEAGEAPSSTPPDAVAPGPGSDAAGDELDSDVPDGEDSVAEGAPVGSFADEDVASGGGEEEGPSPDNAADSLVS